MLDRVREIAATADRILMGAVSQTNPIASPTLNQTPSIGAIPEDVADSHASAAASQAAMVGATDLSSRFIIGELIAVGGMANVFLATEIATARKVIWKQAHGEFNPLHVSNQKLADEVELLQIARHPRIPDYLAHGGSIDSKGEGQHCSVLIEEYIPGGDLKNTIEQITKVGAVISLPKIIEYMVAICEPLEHMANLAQPVYHRDLKPHNIIIHPERGPVLIDFGLAKMVATGEDVSITRGGSGTWTPPERDAGVSGPFTDVYSLGKILYFLLTNQPPAAILTTEKLSPITATGHPEWIADLTLRAAWPDQNDRIQTVREFRIFLENEGYWPDGIEMESSAGADDYTTWE
jgi:serine/threonine protein kinase